MNKKSSGIGLWVSIALMVIALDASSQQGPLPMNYWFNTAAEASVASKDSVCHTALKPLNAGRFQSVIASPAAPEGASLFKRKLFFEHAIDVKGEDYRLTIDPLFDFSYGMDSGDTSKYSDTTAIFTNIRGLVVQGDVGSRFSFQSGLYECQSFLPLYQRDITKSLGVVPGMGRTKTYRNANGFDYANSFGSVNFSPTANLEFTAGYGKQFIGYGYRSMLLSDAAFNYPYLRGVIYAWQKRIQYSSSYASIQSLERLPLGQSSESLFKRKAASFHYLSIIPHPRIEVGLFENIIWQRWDSTGTKALQPGVFIPIVGLNTIAQGFQKKNACVIGVNGLIKITNHLQAYGQWATSDPSAKRFASQFGVRLLNLFTEGFCMQVEFNTISRYYYSNPISLQSFTHYNQPLASPVGSGSNEMVILASYKQKRWMALAKLNQFTQTMGPGSDWSNNGNAEETLIEYLDRKVTQLDAQMGYVVNPSTNATIMLGATFREAKIIDGANLNSTSFIYLSFRTQLNNRYFDF